MKKYWTIFKLELQKDMQYRFNFFISIISSSFFLIFFLFFWTKIYSEGNKIGSYGLKAILTYYVITVISSQMLFRETSWIVSNEISEGQMNNFLLKPVSYFLNHAARYAGSLTAIILNYLPFIFIAWLFLKNYFAHPVNLLQWAFFACSFGLAAIIYFLIFYTMGLASFWIERIWGLSYGFFTLSNFMGGKLLPLDLFPQWFIKLSAFLPFKYMIYEPVEIFLNKIPFNFISLLVPAGWILMLCILAGISWNRGIRAYEAYGA